MTTTPPPDLDRRVRQLDNDVQSLYSLIHNVVLTQERHGNRLQEMGEDLGSLLAAQEAQRVTLGEHTETLAAILELLRSSGHQP